MMTQNVQKECPLDCWLHHLQQNHSPPRREAIMKLVGRKIAEKYIIIRKHEKEMMRENYLTQKKQIRLKNNKQNCRTKKYVQRYS